MDSVKKVKEILDLSTLYKTKEQPGVYCIYFEKDDLVYIGQSINISKEISTLKGGYRLQVKVNEAFLWNASNVSAYAVSQGPDWADAEKRTKLESSLILKAGSKAINILGNIGVENFSLADNPQIIRPKFIPFKGSWEQLGLSYDNLEFPNTGSSIYIFLNKYTGNFYIGESTNRRSMINRHTRYINSSQLYSLKGMTVRAVKKYDEIVRNIKDHDSEFFYSAIINTQNMNHESVIILEREVRKQASQTYGNRLYNPLSPSEEIVRKNLIARSANLIPPKSIAARTTQLPFLPNTFMFPVILKGEWYVSMGEVTKKLGIPVTTLKSRCLSPQYPDYIWLKDISSKILPPSKDIQEKIEQFNKKMLLANLYYFPEVKKTRRSTLE